MVRVRVRPAPSADVAVRSPVTDPIAITVSATESVKARIEEVCLV